MSSPAADRAIRSAFVDPVCPTTSTRRHSVPDDCGAQRLDVQGGAIEFRHGVEGNGRLFDRSPSVQQRREFRSADSLHALQRLAVSAGASALSGIAAAAGSTVSKSLRALRVLGRHPVERVETRQKAIIAASAHQLPSAHSHAVTVGSDPEPVRRDRDQGISPENVEPAHRACSPSGVAALQQVPCAQRDDDHYLL